MNESATALTGAAWRKSTRSVAANGCVEIAALPGTRAVRDSKHPGGPALLFPTTNFHHFLTALSEVVAAGESAPR